MSKCLSYDLFMSGYFNVYFLNMNTELEIKDITFRDYDIFAGDCEIVITTNRKFTKEEEKAIEKGIRECMKTAFVEAAKSINWLGTGLEQPEGFMNS